MKLKKGDQVVISSGKDKGKRGKIEKINYKDETVFLPGLNLYKKHLKKKDEKSQGGIIDFSRPVPIASVSLVCPKCGNPTRVGFLLRKDRKVRICKKCKAEI